MKRPSPDVMRYGSLIAWIAVTLLGLSVVGWGVWFYLRAGGSYLALPEILGLTGVYVAFQGVKNVRRILKGT